MPVPPNRLRALRLCRIITFSGVIAPGDATAAGAEALFAEAPKSVKKNILRIPHKNCIIPVLSGSVQSRYAMTCAAPEGTPPWRFNYLKTPPLASQEPVKDPRAPSQFFMVW